MGRIPLSCSWSCSYCGNPTPQRSDDVSPDTSASACAAALALAASTSEKSLSLLWLASLRPRMLAMPTMLDRARWARWPAPTPSAAIPAVMPAVVPNVEAGVVVVVVRVVMVWMGG
jgi:hypothetical protein